MKIALDISQINRDHAGINHYLYELIRELGKREYVEVYLYSREVLELKIPLAHNFQQVVIPNSPWWEGKGLGWYWKLGRDLKQRGVDALITNTMNMAPLFFSHTIMIVNDMVPFTHPETVEKSLYWRYLVSGWVTSKFAWQVHTISAATTDQFLKFYPDYKGKLVMIGAGLNQWVYEQPTAAKIQQVTQKYQLPEEYLLTVGTLQPRKNHINMIRAFARLLPTHPNLNYVIAGGKGWFYEQIFAEVEKLGITEKVHFLGYMEEDELPVIYDAAKCFAFCSLEEGFGLPIIEARARGLPVVCSNIPVFTEIKVDDYVMFVDPHAVNEIADSLTSLLKSPKKPATNEFMREYSWEKVTDVMLGSLNPQ